jgi:hypothetical protein
VAPREAARAPEDPSPEAAGGAQQAALDEARLDQWARRRAWIDARRRAD